VTAPSNAATPWSFWRTKVSDAAQAVRPGFFVIDVELYELALTGEKLVPEQARTRPGVRPPRNAEWFIDVGLL
jgi:hypothetical protein